MTHLPGPQNPGECHLYVAEGCHLYIHRAIRRAGSSVRAGATGFTHLGNGCPRELDRHDNIVWRALDTPGFTASLIPDGIHVSPALFRLIHRALGPEAIYYTSDAMSAAGAPPGRYRLGALEVEVGADQIVRQPGKTNFAGSALRPIDGIFRAAEMLNCPWQEVWGRWSQKPSAFMGLPRGLEPGQPANLCRLKFNGGNRLSELQVLAGRDYRRTGVGIFNRFMEALPVI